MGKSTSFSEDDLRRLGLAPNKDGSWSKAPKEMLKKVAQNELIVAKLKVNDSPQFTAKPVTEWFIKGYSVPSKKNSRQNFVRNGKQISIPSKKHAEYVKVTAMQYEVFGREFRRSVEQLKLNYPLNVEFTFIRNSKHSFDYCNACQTCEDIMKDKYDKKGNLIKKMWIPDDSVEYLKPSFGDFEYNKNEFGVKIKLLVK